MMIITATSDTTKAVTLRAIAASPHGIGELVVWVLRCRLLRGVRIDAGVAGWQARGFVLIRGDGLPSGMIKVSEA